MLKSLKSSWATWEFDVSLGYMRSGLKKKKKTQQKYIKRLKELKTNCHTTTLCVESNPLIFCKGEVEKLRYQCFLDSPPKLAKAGTKHSL